MRTFLIPAFVCALANAQEIPVPATAPSPAAVTQPGSVSVDVAPMRAPDLTTVYASPRDAARHRFQSTMSDLQSKRDVRAALRGFADAIATDSTYSAAAFNVGVTAALSEKWDDANSAFEEAVKLDPSLAAQAKPQVERLRLIATLEATSDGKLRRRYNEALLPVLAKLSKMQTAEALAALADVGRIDPKRWEAPALLAGLSGNGRGYDEAARFLQIAVANASDPKVKESLQTALAAAERERRYRDARGAAELASDQGDHAKAAELFETAWNVVPTRCENGLNAASEVLMQDDTARAATLLARLRNGSDSKLVEVAAAMLKNLEPIEAKAKSDTSDAAQFFRDAGPLEPVRISTLLPAIDKTEMELLMIPLPKLAQDADAVVLLSSLSADGAGAQTMSLPVLPEPSITFDNAWKEVLRARQGTASIARPVTSARELEVVDLSKVVRTARLLKVNSVPEGASVFLEERPGPVCQTPCDIRTDARSQVVRLSLPGYKDEEQNVSLTGKLKELAVTLNVIRGFVIVETLSPAPVKVDGTLLNISTPVELALLPGVHFIGAQFGASSAGRMLTVKPGARLRLQLNR